MRNIFIIKILFLIFFISSSFARTIELEFYPYENIIKQGALTSGVLKSNEDFKKLNFLEGKKIDDFIYIHSIKEQNATVIFLKPSDQEFKKLSQTFGSDDIILSLNSVKILPSETSDKMEFAPFDVTSPSTFPFIEIVALMIILCLISFVTFKFYIKWRFKKNQLIKNKEIMAFILNVKTYEDVIECWSQKDKILMCHPHLRDSFKKFENVLYQYQFKRHQTEEEKSEILKSFEKFKNSVSEKDYGI